MIQLQSVSIKNFRGIRDGKIDGLTEVNLLVGRNNSGKTTVMESITQCATTAGLNQDMLGRQVIHDWQEVRQLAGAPQELMWYRQDKSKDIAIAAVITETSLAGLHENIHFRLFGSPAQGGRQVHPAAGQTSIDAGLKLRFFSKTTVLRPLDAFDKQIEQRFWHGLLSNRRDKALTATLNEVFGLNAESFQLLPNNQLMVLFDDYSLPLDCQGDGTRTALRMMMVLSMMKGTLLMLEEPGCYQHPGSLERFSTALCKLAKAQEVQLIISTHSSDCVRSFLQAAKTAQSDAAVFHLTLEKGKQDARRLDPEAVETLISTGVDVRCLDLYA
jgi:predicted ATPase